MYVVIDNKLDGEYADEGGRDVFGPFDSEEAAEEWDKRYRASWSIEHPQGTSVVRVQPTSGALNQPPRY